MKKILLFALVVTVAANNVSAQTEKGNWLPGLGVASAGGLFNENNSSTSISINPSVGYFIKDNLAIGSSVGLGFGTSNGTYNLTYGLHPFIRPYFSKMEARTKFFAEATVGIWGYKNFGEYAGSDAADHDLVAAIKCGTAYFLSPDVSVETTIGVSAWGALSNPLSGVIMPNIGIGFRAYINRKVNCWPKN